MMTIVVIILTGLIICQQVKYGDLLYKYNELKSVSKLREESNKNKISYLEELVYMYKGDK